jgi:hypothetical protein
MAMTDEAKLNRLKIFLQEKTIDNDALLSEYLDASKDEILNWLYIRVGAVPEDVTTVPARYEQTQIFAVLAGFNIMGAEGQTLHIENGMHRQFVYDDMIKYIRTHVFPYVGMPG